jgi:integrase
VKIYDPDGQPVSQSSKSADYGDGKKLRQKTSGEKSRGEVSGGALGKVRISELLDDVLQSDIADSTRKIWKMVIEKSTRPFFGKVKSTRLTTEIMKAYRRKKLADGRVDATANRELSILRTDYHNGRKLTPPKVIQVPYLPMIKEENTRQRLLEDDQYTILRDQLLPEIRPLFVCDCILGLRGGELLNVTWDKVDLREMVIRIPARSTKGKRGKRRGRNVPILAGDMEDMLRAAKKERDEKWFDSPWVFNRKGEKVLAFRGAWDAAIERAGIHEVGGRKLTPYDLRRTSVRIMRRAGVPQVIRMQISGHKTDSMERRYNIADDEDIAIAKKFLDERMKSLAKAGEGAGLKPEEKRSEG